MTVAQSHRYILVQIEYGKKYYGMSCVEKDLAKRQAEQLNRRRSGNAVHRFGYEDKETGELVVC